MKIITENEILENILGKNITGIYVFIGTQYYKKKEIIELIKKQYQQIEFSSYDSKDLDLNLLFNDLLSNSFFSFSKLVVLKNYEAVKKVDKEKLFSYFQAPNKSTIFVIFWNEDLKQKDIEEEFGKFDLICVKINPLSYEEKIRYIKKEFEKNSKEIDDLALSYIADCIDDYGILVNEINKILIYLKDKKRLTFDEACEIVDDLKEVDRYKIIDAIISNDKNKLFQITEDLIEKKESPHSILSVFLISLEKLFKINILQKSNINDYSLISSLGVFKNELTSSFRFINEEEILKVIDYILSTENTFKTTTDLNPYILIRNISYIISVRLMTS